MTTLNHPKNYRKRIAMYALIGPIIGLLIVDLVIIGAWIFEIVMSDRATARSNIDIPDAIKTFLAINLYGIIVAYIVGILPAILTGTIAAQFRTYKSEAICAMLVGAAPFTFIYIVTAIIENKAINSEYLSLITLAVIGAISGLVCAGLRRPEKAAHTG